MRHGYTCIRDINVPQVYVYTNIEDINETRVYKYRGYEHFYYFSPALLSIELAEGLVKKKHFIIQ